MSKSVLYDITRIICRFFRYRLVFKTFTTRKVIFQASSGYQDFLSLLLSSLSSVIRVPLRLRFCVPRKCFTDQCASTAITGATSQWHYHLPSWRLDPCLRTILLFWPFQPCPNLWQPYPSATRLSEKSSHNCNTPHAIFSIAKLVRALGPGPQRCHPKTYYTPQPVPVM